MMSGGSNSLPGSAASPRQPAGGAAARLATASIGAAPGSKYRGQNSFGAPIAQPIDHAQGRVKTWQQLNEEQGVVPDADGSKNVGTAVWDATKGGVVGLGSAGLNLVGTLAGRPLTYAYDQLTGSNTNQVLNQGLVHLQDYRDRGMHQLLRSTQSNALNDRFNADTQLVQTHGTPAQQRLHSWGRFGADTLPLWVNVAGAGKGDPSNAVGQALRRVGQGGQSAGMTAQMFLSPAEQQAMAAAQVRPGANGAEPSVTINGLTGSRTVNLSELQPDEAQFLWQHPVIQNYYGQQYPNAPLPKNILSPAERVSHGAFDPTTGRFADLTSGINTDMAGAAPAAEQPDASGITAADYAALNAQARTRIGQQFGLGNNPVPQLLPPGLPNNPQLPAEQQPPSNDVAAEDSVGDNVPTPNAAAAVGTTQNPAPQQTAATDPAPEDPFGDYVETLKTAPAETKQQIEQQTVVPAVVEQIKPSITPEKTEAATLVATKPGTPEAEAAAAPARDQFITAQAGGDPAKPQDPGWYGQVLGMWDSMGPMGQAAFMLGVPTALIGLLSGDGLAGILGGLGIGLLGMGAGAMGMFGAGTQKSMGQLMGQLGGAMGYNVERDANNLMPGSDASKKFEADLTAAYLKDPAEAQKMLDARTAQFQPLEQLHSIHPELAHSYLMGMDNGPATAEDAAKLYQQLAGQVTAARDPNFLHNQAGSKIINNVNNLKKTVPALLQFGKNLIQNYKTSADMNIAQKIAAKHMLKKASRCWAGYEPVPGKEPYSNNSCRPVGSKKKKQTGKERHHEKTKQGGAKG